MGELTFFLGLQVKQQPDGIFISQDKYVVDILKKFDFWSIRTATTPIESNKPLVMDEDGEDVDVIKIHTDSNVVDLLTKGFDVSRFNFLVMIMVFELSAKLCNAVWFVFEGSSYGTKLVSAASFG
ncbi:hypothetical protein Tco_1471961 [Tanacetum coccineum]